MTPLLRLMTWLSPAFPVGGFSWSHGLEAAVEAGLVRDRDGTSAWIASVLKEGSGRLDAALFLKAWEAGDDDALDRVSVEAEAWRGTGELALESATQGAAFLTAVLAAWPRPELAAWRERLRRDERRPAYAVAVAVAARLAGIGRDESLGAFLHAFAANMVSAAVRLVPLGQSDGLKVLSRLEPLIPPLVADAIARPHSDMGTSTPMLDWCSLNHETQYTRLFRS